jgi:hypothetical protein
LEKTTAARDGDDDDSRILVVKEEKAEDGSIRLINSSTLHILLHQPQ